MFSYFLRREIQNKYNSTWSTIFWLIVQPLLTLAVYYFVFTHIFTSRVGENSEISFVSYLAIGLWPWMAFSESLTRSVTSVSERKDLIGKVKIDLRTVLLANISAIYLLHLIGYILVISVLLTFGKLTFTWHFLLAFLPLALLFILSYTIGLFISAIHVFYKDVLQIVSAILPLMFFTVPIIYSLSIIPVQYHHIMTINPLFEIINSLHNSFFFGEQFSFTVILKYFLVVIPLLFVGQWFFKKLAVVFDDYL